MVIGSRIREERERLGYTQQEFARLGGATKNSQLSWEKGIASPNARVMNAWAAVGVDVLYILTGQRSQLVAPQELLPEGDRILLNNFHAAPDAVRAGVKTTLSAFADKGGERVRKKAA